MTKIVLLEFVDEFEAFREYLRQGNYRIEDFLIIAIDSKVGAYLKTQNIPYQDTLNYFNSDSQRRILVKAEEAMELIRKRFLFSDENGARMCYQVECLHYLRLFLNHILKTLEIIESISTQHSDLQWYAYVKDGVSVQPLIGSSERYCGVLLRRFAECHQMDFFQINRSFVARSSVEKIKKSFSVFEKMFFNVVVGFLQKKKIILVPRVNGPFSGLVKDIFTFNNRIVFLAVDSHEKLSRVVAYNMVSLFKLFFLRNQPPYCIVNVTFFNSCISGVQREALSRAVDKLMDEAGEPIFSYSGVKYIDLVRRKVEIAIKPHLERICAFSYALRYIFNRLDVDLVMSYIGVGIMGVAGELAGVMKKKSLFISHGSHPVPVDEYHELELYNHCRSFMLGDYTHVALCTPIQEAHLHYFKNKHPEIISHEIKTGPLIFTNLKCNDNERYKKELGISRDCCVFTQAVSIKPRYGERFYFLETMDEFFSGLTDIIKVINMLSNVKLIIRFHPGFSWSDEEIRSLLPVSDKYIINQDGPFSRVLGATDALISYSSTTIDEALINRIPVLLYDKWNRYNHFQTEVFVDANSKNVYPVCYVNAYDKLASTFKFMLQRIESANREDMNVQRYCYEQNYRDNFYSFIYQALNLSKQ